MPIVIVTAVVTGIILLVMWPIARWLRPARAYDLDAAHVALTLGRRRGSRAAATSRVRAVGTLVRAGQNGVTDETPATAPGEQMSGAHSQEALSDLKVRRTRAALAAQPRLQREFEEKLRPLQSEKRKKDRTD